MANGKHIFRGTVEVPVALTNQEAVNLGQVRDMLDRYVKEPVMVATTSELAVADNTDGVLTLSVDVNTIDGVTLNVDDAILVKDQLDKVSNGVYIVTDLGTSGTLSSASATVSGTGITSATVDKTVFEAQVGTPTTGTYSFVYDGVTDNSWKLDGNIVVLADYGITEVLVGTDPVDQDKIEISYTERVAGTGAVLTRREDFAIDKVILNNTTISVMQGDTFGDTKWTLVSDGVLTCGSSSFVFVKDVDTAEGSINVIKTTITGDDVTTEFNVAHNLNLTDAQAYMIYVKDATGSNCYVDDAPTVGNEANALTLSFAVAPEATETFKIFILGLE